MELKYLPANRANGRRRIGGITLVLVSLLLLAQVASAQANSDKCHVYVVDVAKARLAFEKFRPTGNDEIDARALNAGATEFPEFGTVVGEEELTTKHFRFPNSNLWITASVYYTDESMASSGSGADETHSESMLMGVLIADKAQPNAVSSNPFSAAITEVTYDESTNKVRAKKYLKVSGRDYLVGFECDCMTEKRGKK